MDDPRVKELLGADARDTLAEEIALLDAASSPFDEEGFRHGTLSPVFFGSALINFGVETFLKWFLRYAPPPGPRATLRGDVSPAREEFSGFVFKIQANMDPRHRDRVAFVRVCSGRFTKDMTLTNSRLAKSLRASRAYRFFGRDREIIKVAYAGDIIGLYDPGVFRIGDTLTTGKDVRFEGIPHFSPELFRRVRVGDPLKRKQLLKGLVQLAEEGAIQIFADYVTESVDIVGAVGQLQFDVLKARLQTEYRVEAILETQPYTLCRWIIGEGFDPKTFRRIVE